MEVRAEARVSKGETELGAPLGNKVLHAQILAPALPLLDVKRSAYLQVPQLFVVR